MLYPFQEQWYLDLFAKHFCPECDTVDPTFPFEKQGDSLILLGMKKVLGVQEITDYGNSIVSPPYLVGKAKEFGCSSIVLDYIREDSEIYRYWLQRGAKVEKQEVAPFIILPKTWEEYLESLGRVERKELKRKLKRLSQVPSSFEIIPTADEHCFQDFIRLHKQSDQNKNKFMSKKMELFFHDLAFVEKKDWQSNFAVLKIQRKTAAIIFFFENVTHALLYNSGYDSEFRFYSSGLMAHAFLIKRNIEKELKIHDFLRGNERYKYDLGAKDMNLYKISITL